MCNLMNRKKLPELAPKLKMYFKSEIPVIIGRVLIADEPRKEREALKLHRHFPTAGLPPNKNEIKYRDLQNKS